MQFGQREHAMRQSHGTPGNNQQACGCVLMLHCDAHLVRCTARTQPQIRRRQQPGIWLEAGSTPSHNTQAALHHLTSFGMPKRRAKAGAVQATTQHCASTSHSTKPPCARHLNDRRTAQTTTHDIPGSCCCCSQQMSGGGLPPMTSAHPTVSFPPQTTHSARAPPQHAATAAGPPHG